MQPTLIGMYQEPLMSLWAILDWLENCSSQTSAPRRFISVCKVLEKKKENTFRINCGWTAVFFSWFCSEIRIIKCPSQGSRVCEGWTGRLVTNCSLTDKALHHHTGPQWTSEFTAGVLQRRGTAEWIPSWPQLINSLCLFLYLSLSVSHPLSPFLFLLLPAYLSRSHLSSLIILCIVHTATLFCLLPV